jgi:hypothetical protein
LRSINQKKKKHKKQKKKQKRRRNRRRSRKRSSSRRRRSKRRRGRRNTRRGRRRRRRQAEPLPPVSCFDYSSTLKMTAIYPSETLAILRTTRVTIQKTVLFNSKPYL